MKVTVALADHGKQVYVAALNGNFQQIVNEGVGGDYNYLTVS